MVSQDPIHIGHPNRHKAKGQASPSLGAQINGEFGDKLEEMASGYDRMEIEGQPPPWSQVLAVFAVKAAGAKDGNTYVGLLHLHCSTERSPE